MSLSRQGRQLPAVGLVQWLLDWGVLVGLSHLGLPVHQANVAGRITARCWASGSTGASLSPAKARRWGAQFMRFLAMWVTLTWVSTEAIGTVDDYLGLEWAWLAKPAVEVALGGVGFLLSRYWVYRR